MNNKQAFVMVVVPISQIKKFVVIDIVGGTVLYYMLELPLHSVLAATVGSIVGPVLIRRSLKSPGKRNRPTAPVIWPLLSRRKKG